MSQSAATQRCYATISAEQAESADDACVSGNRAAATGAAATAHYTEQPWAHSRKVNCLAVTQDPTAGLVLYSGGEEGIIRIWKAQGTGFQVVSSTTTPTAANSYCYTVASIVE
eukprot:1566-Heterococcus_DN1.PRE.2